MKRSLLITAALFFLGACATAPADVRRLSPVSESSQAPQECRIVSIVPNSPALKSGLQVGDRIQSVNGTIPTDASAVADLVAKSPPSMELVVISSTETSAGQHLKVDLNDKRPRLGAMCDLTGWRKSGVTAAGNESLTVFSGPFAFTVSGILDKGIAFIRVRLTNDSDQAVAVDPGIFSGADGKGVSVPVMLPRQVMCSLSGEKGAHLLALKHRKSATLEATNGALTESTDSESCSDVSIKNRLPNASADYMEANAQYLATDSLWPVSVVPGATADGLIYFPEPPSLPLAVTMILNGHSLTVRLGMPQAQQKVMSESALVKFFEPLKKGTPVRLTTRKGKVFVGKFSLYDSVEDKAWFDNPSAGLLTSISYPITSIRYVERMDQIPASAQPVSDTVN